MIGRLIETGICCVMEINAKKSKATIPITTGECGIFQIFW